MATGTAPASASTPTAGHTVPATSGNTATPAAPQVVSTLVGPHATVTLPQSGLYTVSTSPTSHYLIETNPQFTQFISSDYLLQQLGYNPEATEQRLGDGFYEEQQVLDQITDLTGRRFLGNETDALDQYRQLMANAVDVAKPFDLAVGVALTPAQMASLTQDIVWLVNVTVDGHQVLEPVVYLSATDAQHLAASGATIAGQNVILDASGTLTNNGTISASNDAQITANNLLNSGTISAGNNLSIDAAQDILNGGTIRAGGNVSLVAGNDVLSGVSVAQGLGAVNLGGLGSPVSTVALTNLSMPGSISAGGNLSISAGRDLALDTAPVAAGANLSLAAGRDLTATATALTAGGDAQLLAGRDLSLLSTASTHRTGETHNSVETTTHTISTLTAGGTLNLLAGNDLLSQGATLTGSTLNLAAANNLTLAAVTDSTTRTTQGMQGHTLITTGQTDQTVRGSTLTGTNGIDVSAGRDLTAVASTLSSANGNVALVAGNNLNLDSAQENDSSYRDTVSSHHGLLSSSKTQTQATSSDSDAIGTTVSGNNVTLAAGNNLTTQAAQLEANNALSLSAANDVTLGAGEQTHTSSYAEEQKSSSVFNTGATRFGSLDPESYRRGSQSSTAQTWSIGSTLSGDTVSVAAGHDLTGTAVQIAGTHDVTLAAGNNLTLTAGQDTYSQSDSTTVSRTGLMNGGGFSALIGNRTTKDANTVNDVSYTGSLVGSTNGAVTLTAGNDVHITGSDVLSQTATTIVGKAVTIDAALGSEDTTQMHKQSSAGISVGLSGGVAAVAQSVYGAAQGASQSSDSRLKALYAMQAAQDLYSPGAGHAMGLGNGETGYQALANTPSALANSGSAQQASQNTGISLHVGIGGGSTTSTAKTHDDVAYGSQISSQGNVTIAATNGDLNVIGSQVNGNDVALSASHDLNLLSQAEQHTDSNTSHNASGEVGLSIGQTTGIYLSASAGEALAHGNGTTHDDTVVNAANTLTLASGNDTTIRGAQATGNSVLAAIGGNLDVASEQDTNDYASHSLQAGITLVYGWSNGGVGVSGSLSASKAKANYASVTQMSGIGAGSGGFDIDVHGTTDLTGAVIASTANPADNLLTTGSLTYSNIANVAKSSAESISVGGGYGTGSLSGMTSLTGGIGVPQNSDQHSTTQAGIAQGTITVLGNPNQSLSGLDRNPSLDNANGLTDSFNPQKAAENEQAGLLAGQVGMTAAGDVEQAAGMQNGSTGAIALHTVIGGAAAALGGGNVLQGAAGAGASEAAIPYLEKYGTSGVLVGTTLVGALVGGGSGVSTALSGTEYNYLSHPQRQQEQQQLAACGNDAACQQKVTAYWNQISASQSLNMTASLVPGSYTVDLADANPYAPGYDNLLATAIAQSASNGALNPVIAQGEMTLVNEADGEPTVSTLIGPTQAQLNALNSALLGPVFGVAGNATQYFGGSPSQVAAANDLGGTAFVMTTAGEWGGGQNALETTRSGGSYLAPNGNSIELPAPVSMTDIGARNWYLSQEAQIPGLIDTSDPLEQQAYQAWGLRNVFRSAARDGMINQDVANDLDVTSPNLTWGQTVQKYSASYSGDALWDQIISASQRSNNGVNQWLGADPSTASGAGMQNTINANNFPSPKPPACTGLSNKSGCP